jgi:serine/threonine protein kinase
VHKDIKLDNIFVSEDDDKPHVVLGDFGYTAHKDMCYKKLYIPPLIDRCGTPGYLAPEILEHGEIDEKSDIFSTGIIFHIL